MKKDIFLPNVIVDPFQEREDVAFCLIDALEETMVHYVLLQGV